MHSFGLCSFVVGITILSCRSTDLYYTFKHNVYRLSHVDTPRTPTALPLLPPALDLDRPSALVPAVLAVGGVRTPLLVVLDHANRYGEVFAVYPDGAGGWREVELVRPQPSATLRGSNIAFSPSTSSLFTTVLHMFSKPDHVAAYNWSLAADLSDRRGAARSELDIGGTWRRNSGKSVKRLGRKDTERSVSREKVEERSVLGLGGKDTREYNYPRWVPTTQAKSVGLEFDPCTDSLFWSDSNTVVQSVVKHGKAISRPVFTMQGAAVVTSLHFDRLSGSLFVASNSSVDDQHPTCDVWKLEMVPRVSSQSPREVHQGLPGSKKNSHVRRKRGAFTSPLLMSRKAAKDTAEKVVVNSETEAKAPSHGWKITKVIGDLPDCYVASLGSDGKFLYMSDWSSEEIVRLPLNNAESVNLREEVHTVLEIRSAVSVFGVHGGADGLVVDRIGDLNGFEDSIVCSDERAKKLAAWQVRSKNVEVEAFGTKKVLLDALVPTRPKTVEADTDSKVIAEDRTVQSNIMSDSEDEITDFRTEMNTLRSSAIIATSGASDRFDTENIVAEQPEEANNRFIHEPSTEKSITKFPSRDYRFLPPFPRKTFADKDSRKASGSAKSQEDSSEDSIESTTLHNAEFQIAVRNSKLDSLEESFVHYKFPGMSRGQLSDMVVVLMVLTAVLMTSTVLMAVALIRYKTQQSYLAFEESAQSSRSNSLEAGEEDTNSVCAFNKDTRVLSSPKTERRKSKPRTVKRFKRSGGSVKSSIVKSFKGCNAGEFGRVRDHDNDGLVINIEDCCQMQLCETPCYTSMNREGRKYGDTRGAQSSEAKTGLLDEQC